MSDSIVIEESNGEIVVIEPTVVINQGGNSAWGEIGGDIGNQSDLVAEFAKKMNVEPTVLPVNTDYDTLITNGVYQVDYNIITVKVAENSTSDTFVNQVMTSDDGTMQYRYRMQYQSEAPIWSDWREFAWWDYTLEELDKKVDKVTGKGLSTNDYTTTEKDKLAGIEAGAQVNVIPTWNSVTDKPETFPPAAHTHSGMVTSSTVAEIVTLTQAAYDALNPKVATTLYIITGA